MPFLLPAVSPFSYDVRRYEYSPYGCIGIGGAGHRACHAWGQGIEPLAISIAVLGISIGHRPCHSDRVFSYMYIIIVNMRMHMPCQVGSLFAYAFWV